MPYLSDLDKARVDSDGPTTPGDLNYVLTKVALYYLKRKMNGGPFNYAMLAEIKSAFAEARDEFSRRLMTPYEEIKIHQNGDVYDVF
jgi:hypothetical protein